jgi:hypothetical protein
MKKYEKRADTAEFLKSVYGNHTKAAKALGISVEHYRRWRNQDMGSHVLEMMIAYHVIRLHDVGFKANAV